MKNIAVCIVITFCLPLLIYAQPLISNLEAQQQTELKKSVSLTPSDLIQPVLLRDQTSPAYDNSIQKLFTDKPGLALLSSGLLPGSGQLVNKNWIRGGLYAALEVAAIYMVIEFDNRGDSGKQRYENYADQNWSVTQYAKWLVEYHDVNQLDNPALENLRSMVEDLEPAFDTDIDWNNIDIDILRAVERESRFVTPDNLSNSNFSHILPGYGSQQYYELISKYYQFQAGWQDYYGYHESSGTTPYLISRDGSFASDMFFRGATLADEFNNDFRTSKNFRMLLIANHLLSAFDSFFTFKLKQNRIQATTSMAPTRYLQVSVNF
jgi:hypothetical protein